MQVYAVRLHMAIWEFADNLDRAGRVKDNDFPKAAPDLTKNFLDRFGRLAKRLRNHNDVNVTLVHKSLQLQLVMPLLGDIITMHLQC